MSAATAWTDDRVQTLTRLWLEGQSASQIARALAGGVTRNAVIGKVHRLGLSGRAKPSTPGARPPRAARLRRPPRAVASTPRRTILAPPAAPPEVGTATIRTVRRGQCRWPYGDPQADRFSLCGAAAVRGAYCAAHAALAYRAPSARPPRDNLLKLAGLA
jgi:GcrA cell cycle regulator